MLILRIKFGSILFLFILNSALVKILAVLNGYHTKDTATNDHAIIFFHGLDDDGLEWNKVFNVIGLPNTSIIIPKAQMIPLTIKSGNLTYAWFDFKGAERLNNDEDEEGINRAKVFAHSLIQKEIDKGILSNKIVIGGFCQGGALALLAGLTFPKKLAGIFAIASWLPLYNKFSASWVTHNRNTSIFLRHGEDDSVIPSKYGMSVANKLKDEGIFNVSYRSHYNVPHKVSDTELRDMLNFVKLRLFPEDTGESWGQVLSAARFPNTHIVVPTAKQIILRFNSEQLTYAWFDFKDIESTRDGDENEINRAKDSVHQMIQNEMNSGSSSDRIIVGGFSQGGALALLAGLTFPKKLGGIIVLSGWLPFINKFNQSWIINNRDVPIFICHGNRDDVVPSEFAIHVKEKLNELSSYRNSVIFFHGIEDTGDSWEKILTALEFPNTNIIVPTAEKIPLTFNWKQLFHAWFDIKDIANLKGDKDNEKDINRAKIYAHSLIQAEINKGVPCDKIIIGGYSQGGALALLSGLTFPEKLAGIITLSGWLPLYNKFNQSWITHNRDTPILVCQGQSDTIISPELVMDVVTKLNELSTNVTYKSYTQKTCTVSTDELNGIIDFIKIQFAYDEGQHAIIFFHGLGEAPDSWLNIFKKLGFPNTNIIVPSASEVCIINKNTVRHEPIWYDFNSFNSLINGRNEKELNQIKSYAHGKIKTEILNGVPPANIIVAGISQGGAVALLAGLTYPAKLAGIIELSGWLPLYKEFNSSWVTHNHNIPILMSHSAKDSVISTNLCMDILGKVNELSENVTFKMYPDVGLQISRLELKEIIKFVKRQFYYGAYYEGFG